MNNSYAQAYAEVLEILKYIPKEEYNRIPKDKIEFYKENMDKSYNFSINPNIDLDKQNISLKANSILVDIYQEFFATEEQKILIDKILYENELAAEEEKRKKYNPDDIFKQDNEKKESIKIEKVESSEALIEYKESFFTKLKKFIFKFLNIK